MNGDERPDPEDLLRKYNLAMRPQMHGRGKLKIFLGAAPGVGKTYAMLREGRRLSAEGRDVVAGLVETHGRAETASELHGLELIPTRSIQYRGVDVFELDVDAVVRRRPDVVLVDELAHTNVTGSRHTKRWRDVEEIRAAGIDVLSTLNVQHLESLSPVVESITGIKIRESVPDRVVEEADEIQLVDLPVDALLDRMRAGKVYPAARAEQAMANFFRPGNLNALRELALRQTAAGVDERLEQYMDDNAIDAIWPAAERVGVLIVDRAEDVLLRSGWRLASGLRSELVAILALQPGESPGEAVVRLVEDLGATMHAIDCQHIVEQLVAYLREENIGVIVMDQSYALKSRILGKSLATNLFERVDNLQIHLVEIRV